MPREQKRRRFLWWWFSGMGIAAIALSLLWATGGLGVKELLSTPVETPKSHVHNKKQEKKPSLQNQTQKQIKNTKPNKAQELPPIAISRKNKAVPTRHIKLMPAADKKVSLASNEPIELSVEPDRSYTPVVETLKREQKIDLLQKLTLGKLEIPESNPMPLSPPKIKKRRKNLLYVSLDAVGNNAPFSLTGGNIETGIIFNGTEKINLSVGIGYGRKVITLKSESAGLIGQLSETGSITTSQDILLATIHPGFVYSGGRGYNGEYLDISKTNLSQQFYSKRAYVYMPIRLSYRLSSRLFVTAGIQVAYVNKMVNFTYDGTYSLLDKNTWNRADFTQEQFNGNGYALTALLSKEPDNRIFSYNSSAVNPIKINSWLLGYDLRLGYQLNPKWSTTLQFSQDLLPVSTNVKLIKRQHRLNLGLGVRRTF